MKTIVEEGDVLNLDRKQERVRFPEVSLRERGGFSEILQSQGPEILSGNEEVGHELDGWWRSGLDAANRSAFEGVGWLDRAGAERIAWGASVYTLAFHIFPCGTWGGQTWWGSDLGGSFEGDRRFVMEQNV